MKKNTIEIVSVKYLRGPNMWTYRSVLEAVVDIGELENYPSNTLPGFNERLTSWLPSLIEHHCSEGVRGGFLQRLAEGTWPAHILEHVTLELQALAGMPGGFGRARGVGPVGVYKVVIRALHEQVTRTAIYHGRDLIMAAINNTPFDVAQVLESLRELADSLCLGPSTACIVDAAQDRRIPYIRLNEGNLVQLGYGCQQRRIWTAETDHTSAIGESISRDKDLTKSLLQQCGVPVPDGRVVDSALDAWNAAQSIGLPVVVKPSDANHGRGVFIDLSAQQDIETAYRAAIKEGSSVIVERFIRGNEHRLLVVDNRVVAAARGETAEVTGDGTSTIAALVESQLNSDPRRGDTEDHPLNPVKIDNIALLELKRQGYAPSSVLPIGQRVLIQRNGNVAFDVTDNVHPSVADAASLAARVVGLDIAGIDMVAEDISQPLDKQRGAIVEVNAGPGLLMHLKPSNGPARPVGKAIVNHLFPEQANGRIPIVGISGSSNGLLARLVSLIVHLSGEHVGTACQQGLYLGSSRCVDAKDAAHWSPANRVLLNRAVSVAVIENTLHSILNEGLAYDRCQIGVVPYVDTTDVSVSDYITDPEHILKVLRTQIDVVLPNGVGVLNADDKLSAALAEFCDGEVLFFGQNAQNAVLETHRAQGKRGVFLHTKQITLFTGQQETQLFKLPQWAEAQPSNTQAVLAAVACAWGLGLSNELICAGIETFNNETVHG